ncbi:Tyrosine-protein kinase transmembrane receptor ROR1 [Trichinella sp. T6]|nr:Tyrosine-protein kinase transmembrane receptor ROR1 [Trichinella sp. T6]
MGDVLIIEPAGSDDYLDEDEVGFNETVEADLTGAQQPYLHLNGLLPNLTRRAGDSVRLKCRVTGSLPITFKWYKNDAPLLKEKNRISVKSRDYWSRLRISNLHVLDSGYYRCDANNKAGKVQSTSLLKVQASTARNRMDAQSALMISADNDYPIHWIGSSMSGTCQPYRGKACARYLAGQKILVHSDDPESMMDTERQLQAAIAVISNNSQVSDACRQYAEQVSCYHNYNVCDQESTPASAVGQPGTTVLPLCKKDCLILEEDLCWEEYEVAKTHGLIGTGALLPDCSRLSDRLDKCIHVIKMDEIDQISPCKLLNTDPCYVGIGQSYRGVASTTVTGKKCGRWSQFGKFFPEYRTVNHPELIGHNHCRNPGGKKPQPWCFTDDGHEELCSVEKCPPNMHPELVERETFKTNGQSNDRPSLDHTNFWNLSSDYFQYIMVAAGVLGVLVLAVMAILFVYCIRSRKARKHKKCSSVYVNGNLCNNVHKNDANHHFELATLLPRTPGFAPQVDLPPEIPACNIQFLEPLGEGAFGKVWKGELIGYSSEEEAIQVAIKTLKEDALPHQKKDFDQEVALTSRLRHANIIELIGVCMTGQLQCMIFEFMIHGDLHEFLLLRAPYTQSGVVDKERILLDQSDFLHIATQIASGMEYLSSQRYVHRDLATRNCFVTDRLTIKIADLGIARDIYSADYYYVQSKTMLPIRWMPPEAILYGRFSEASDVWAFGVVMWEIYTYGSQPYFGFSNQEVIEMVRQRCLLQCPENCPTRMYSLMVECWHETPSRRPQFQELHGRLQTWSVVSTPAHSSIVGAHSAGGAGGAPSLTHRSGSVHSGQSSSFGPQSALSLCRDSTGCLNGGVNFSTPINGYPLISHLASLSTGTSAIGCNATSTPKTTTNSTNTTIAQWQNQQANQQKQQQQQQQQQQQHQQQQQQQIYDTSTLDFSVASTTS